MAFTQVERTDTFEVQRQKINELGAEISTIRDQINNPATSSITREDFNYFPGYYFSLPGGGDGTGNWFNSIEKHPSPYFSLLTSPDPGADAYSYWQIGNSGVLNVFHTVSIASGVSAYSMMQGPFARLPYSSNDGELHEFETLCATTHIGGSGPPGQIEIGLISSNGVGALALVARNMPRSAFFEIKSNGSDRTVRAVVTNSTPTVILDVPILSLNGNIIHPSGEYVFDKLKITITKNEVVFYANEQEVARHTSPNFGTGSSLIDTRYFLPTFHTAIDGNFGTSDLTLSVDYISMKSELVR